MKKNIIGRQKEIEILEKTLTSEKPELLAIYGRRRVGKSFLINEYFEESEFFFSAIGTKNESKKIQLKRFYKNFQQTFNVKEDLVLHEWDDAFNLLIEKCDTLLTKKIILFFDEVAWLDSKKSKFLSALEYSWNNAFSKLKYKNIKIVLCGSSASWMIKKIINSKAGLHNRLTETIRLLPFTLSEVEMFLKHKNINFDRKQIVDLYMAIGGVPKYWTYVQQGQSVPQIIEHLLLDKDGYLYQEFDELYSSLFDDYRVHLNIVKALSDKLTGMSQADLLEQANMPVGGTSVNILRELEESGFILSVPIYNKKKKGKQYRLVDEYSLFYHKWVVAKNKATSKNSWHHQMNSQSYKTWAGYQFENICLKHITQIKNCLGISGIFSDISCWYNKNCQIDLLIERADKSINLCEIKYYDSVISNSKEITESFKKKSEEFKTATETKNTIFTTLISTYGLTKKSNAVDKDITLDDLFL